MAAFDESNVGILWRHFEALSRIPRLSGNEAGVASYVSDLARELGLELRRDGAGNLLINKPATVGAELAPPVLLQAHMDMVGQRDPGSTHDFSRDPLRLIREGEWLRAEGTTLGADNGIGVAAALAVLEARNLTHGPLGVLLTVEEEIGLRGAAALDPSFLDAALLFNLDGDATDELTVGCAGACDVVVEFPLEPSSVSGDVSAFRIRVEGLRGGHSGSDIHRGRENALRLAARLLCALPLGLPWRLVSLRGGEARNAIPRDAEAVFLFSTAQAQNIAEVLRAGILALEADVSAHEHALRIKVEPCAAGEVAASPAASRTLATLLHCCPDGLVRFSDREPDIVETSSNLGIVSCPTTSILRLQFLVRSLRDVSRDALAERISCLFALHGATVSISGRYPGWAPAVSSRSLEIFRVAIREALGLEARVLAVHGGLECGILKAHNPRLDCISYGARILDMHCPTERVHVPSVSQFWSVLARALSLASQV